MYPYNSLKYLRHYTTQLYSGLYCTIIVMNHVAQWNVTRILNRRASGRHHSVIIISSCINHYHTHSIHGTGIFTYMKTIKINQM